MSALAHAVLSLFVGAASLPAPTGEGAAKSVPAPRPVEAPRPVHRPPPARPAAVVMIGIGMVAVASGLSLVGIGIESRRIATQGRTEGELHARVSGSKRLLAVGIPLASAGIAAAVGGIIWIVRDRRRARASHRQ